MKWLDRTLVQSPYHFGLCLSEADFHKELRRLAVPRANWPRFICSETADGTTHLFECGNGAEAAIVCVGSVKGKTKEQIYALLVHEGVHVWQAIRRSLGENAPSSEFEAYAIQNIVQSLFEAWANRKRKK